MTTAASQPGIGYASGTVPRAAALHGSTRLPADKSVAHRALLFNAMGEGEAQVSLFRPGEDVRSTIAALRVLGAVSALTEDADGTVRVAVTGGSDGAVARLPGIGGEQLDCGNSGTAMRLFAGALAGRPAPATLVGDASLSGRPMERIAEPLRSTGADVTTTDGHAPLIVHGHAPLVAQAHELPVASAQVVGCLTLAGLAADGSTTISVPGPTRDHTERMLAWLAAPVRRDGLTTTVVGPSSFRSRSMSTPGDVSAAAAWLVAAALHPDAAVRLEGVGLNPSRIGIISVLQEMGADIEVTVEPDATSSPEPIGTIEVRGGQQLHAIDIYGDRVADVIDELPLISVAMAASDQWSELRDAAELRVKESDRIALVVSNLAAIGADVEELADGWRVRRGTPRPATITTEADHRIAMAFAVAGLTGIGGQVTIDDPACAAVSYPAFWTDMESLVR